MPEDLAFPEGEPGILFGDVDLHNVDSRLEKIPRDWRGLDAIICKALPDLYNVRRAWMPGNSAFLYREHDLEELKGPGSWRLYFLVDNAAAIPNVLAYIYQRLWELGYGFIAIDKRGGAHDKSLIDHCTGTPERIDFLAPILRPGCGVIRRVQAEFPVLLGTQPMLATAPFLQTQSLQEWRRINKRVHEKKAAEKPQCDAIRKEAFKQELPTLRGLNPGASDEALERTFKEAIEAGSLGLDFVLYQPDRSPITVRALLGLLLLTCGPIDLLDPLEPDYRGWRQVAQAYYNSESNTAFINSFAHSGRTFDLTAALRELQGAKWTAGIKLPSTEPRQRPFEESNAVSGNLAIGGDVEYGRVFAERYRGSLLFNAADEAWRRWDGRRWAVAHSTNVDSAGKAASELIFERANELFKKSGSKDALNGAMALWKDTRKQRKMIEAAASEPDMHVESSTVFDTNHWYFNAHNGVIDLRTGELLEAKPVMLISKLGGAAYDSKAKCPRFLKFLEQCIPDADIHEFLQRAIGYTLTGSVREMKWFFCHGLGDNGKSVLMNIIAAVMGEYCVTVSNELLVKSKDSSNEARHQKNLLRGSRLALANELEKGDIWASQRLKEITSQEKINAREHHARAYSFAPTHKLWVRSNPCPGAHDPGDAFWKRMIPIHFSAQIPQQQQIQDLDQIIIAEELPGVLAWIVEGCLAWQRRSIKDHTPASIFEAREFYRQDTDVMGQWLKDYTAPSPEAFTKSVDAYNSFKSYCSRISASYPSLAQFVRELANYAGIERSKDTSNRGFYGFRLKIGAHPTIMS
jgi:putative DNA primase/helicase